MLKFSRKSEYALIALEHIVAHGTGSACSVREISELYQIPFPLLAKIMQEMAGKGLIVSSRGTKGGYQLGKEADEISLADVLEIFDGTLAVADCLKKEKISCPQWNGCKIKSPFTVLNHKIHEKSYKRRFLFFKYCPDPVVISNSRFVLHSCLFSLAFFLQQ